jgi:hypothetical protein
MKHYCNFLVIALLLLTTSVRSQQGELGKVTIAELEQKFHPKDSSASAAILFKKGRSFFTYSHDAGFTVNHVCEVKIKIYKKEGLKWADQKVRFYIGYENLNQDKLEFSNAVTYNLENGAIVKTKLESQGNFTQKINKFWKEKAITLPNVKEGSIIEYKYTLKSENIVQFPDFEIQYDIPVNYFQYKTELPEYYIYKPLLIGNIPLETDSKLASKNQSFANEHNQNIVISYKQIESLYSGKDIPAIRDEPYVDNADNYKGSIKHELERVRMPNQPVKDYSVTWEGVAKTIYKNDNFGKELNEKNFLLDDVKRLLTDVHSPYERMEIIFKYVQNRMNWNKVSDYYTDAGLVRAYREQTGNVAEINFILLNMLRLAGIEANPVLVSTIENGRPVYPTRTGFNYVIVAANIEEKQILLDAANKFTSPDILPFNVLNWKGRLIKEDGNSTEIDLEPARPSKENFNLMAKVEADGKISGQVRIIRSDYDAYRFRTQNSGRAVENYVENFESNLGDIDISSYKAENLNATTKDPVVESFSFTADNQSDVIGDKMFIKPLLFFTQSRSAFVSEKRSMPVFFRYKSQERYSVLIEIPAGFIVEVLPAPIKVATEDRGIVYLLECMQTGNKVQISCVKEINNSIFAADYYDGLKGIFQKIVASQNEKIVLKKEL